MASFSLRSQRTGARKSFTLLDVLKLLGDTINDEIWLEDGEDVYNLSSFIELGAGTGNSNAAEHWSMEVPVVTAGQDTFYLHYTPSVSSDVRLIILNGIVQEQGSDYLQNGREVKFPFQLNGDDKLKFIYCYEKGI